MTSRYLVRIGIVIVGLALALGAIVWLTPRKADGEKWQFYRIGQMTYSPPGLTSELQFARAAGGASDIDSLALLPGSLAFLPKRARAPLFGQETTAPGAPVAAVLEPEKCLLVKSLQFIAPSTGGAVRPRVLLALDQASPQVSLSAKLAAAAPPACAAGAPQCFISIWAEARPKKCA